VSRRELWWRGEKRKHYEYLIEHSHCIGAMRVSHLLERRHVSKRYPTSTTANTSWRRDAKGGNLPCSGPRTRSHVPVHALGKNPHICTAVSANFTVTPFGSHLACAHAQSTNARGHPVLMPPGCRAHTQTTTQVLQWENAGARLTSSLDQ
jgi:hypothetical protein